MDYNTLFWLQILKFINKILKNVIFLSKSGFFAKSF